MIPPFLASAGAKAVAGLIGVAVVAGAIWAYNERQQSIGYNEATQEFHEQIQEQTAQVQTYETNQSEQRVKDVERLLAEKDAFHASLMQANRSYAAENAKLKASLKKVTTPEVIHDTRYIETVVQQETPCLVPDDLVDRVDHLARVLNQIPYDRVPDTGAAVIEPSVRGPSSVACAALVERIEVLTARLGNSMIEHRGLSEFAVKQYKNYQRFLNAQRDGAP